MGCHRWIKTHKYVNLFERHLYWREMVVIRDIEIYIIFVIVSFFQKLHSR